MKIEVIALTLVSFICITSIIVFFLNKGYNYRFYKLEKELEFLSNENDILMKYCLKKIIKDAEFIEDYKTATQALNLLIMINERIKK